MRVILSSQEFEKLTVSYVFLKCVLVQLRQPKAPVDAQENVGSLIVV